MSPREHILQQALSLSHEDRAFIAIALEESLAAESSPIRSAKDAERPSSMIEGVEFLAEVRRRIAAYRAGTTTARSAAEVIDRLRRRQAGEALA